MAKDVKRSSKLYNNLLQHCKKQYKNINFIIRAYQNDKKQIVGIDFDRYEGGISIASNTSQLEVINFID